MKQKKKKKKNLGFKIEFDNQKKTRKKKSTEQEK